MTAVSGSVSGSSTDPRRKEAEAQLQQPSLPEFNDQEHQVPWIPLQDIWLRVLYYSIVY